MMQGEHLWLSEEEVSRSADLELARRVGAVSLEWKVRAQVTRPPPPPNFRRLSPHPRTRPQVMPERPLPQVTVSLATPAPPESPDLKAVVAGEMRRQFGDLKEIIAREVASALGNQERGRDSATLASMLEATLKAVLPQVTGGAPVPSAERGPRAPEEPLYIPSGIVSETKGKVEVQSAKSESSSVGEAAAALKALKKKKRNRDDQR